jgi:hypothetical protein
MSSALKGRLLSAFAPLHDEDWHHTTTDGVEVSERKGEMTTPD